MKLYRNIIIAVVLICILAVGLLFINKIPKENTAEETPKTETKTEYIDVFRLDSKQIKLINVKTEKENYEIEKSGNEFILKNSSDLLIDKQKINSFVTACSYLYVEKIVTEAQDDVSAYGFDTPKATISVNLSDGTQKIIYIGNSTIDNSATYIKVNDDDKIYLKGAYGISNLMPDYNSFISLSVLKVTPTKYETLKNISIYKKGSTAIEIESVPQTTGDNEGFVWKMAKPVYADANGVVLSENVLTPLESFSAVGVTEARGKDLSKFGLDNPYAVLSISAQGISQKFKFGNDVDGYRFFMVDNLPTVYVTKTSNTEFLEVAYIDLMSRLVHLENIKYMHTVEITAPSENFLLKIEGDKRWVNGVPFEIDEFSKIYQNVIAISFDSVDINAKKQASAEVNIKYTRNDGTICNVSYIPVNDRNYLALVDGKGNGIVNKNTVFDALKFIKEKLNEKQ